MKRIREVLLNEYIGAVAIGVILASAISSLIGVVAQSLAYYWESRHKASSVFDTAPQFPWSNLVAGLVPVVLYLLIAYLLLRWLYLRPVVSVERESSDIQLESPAKDDVKS